MIDAVHPLVPWMDCAEFCAQRDSILPDVIALKKQRSMALGPDMTLLFEHPALVWWQIQEMVRIETQTRAQWLEEWEVYRHLLPSAHRVTATLTIEIADPVRRKRALQQRLGIETMICLEGAGYRLMSTPVDTSPAPLSSPMVAEKRSDKSAGLDSHAHSPTSQAERASSGKTNGAHERDHEPSSLSPESHDGASPESMAPASAPPIPQKTCAVHFLAFDLTPHTRALLASAPPVVSCLHPHALARVSMGGELWSALVHDISDHEGM